MVTSKQLNHMLKRPHELQRFLLTGKPPRGSKPSSPLIDVLDALSPRDLGLIQGLTVDSRLGYSGSRRFPTASQALRWLKPADEVFGSYPAESWQDKRFVRRITLREVLDCAAKAPEGLEGRYPALR